MGASRRNVETSEIVESLTVVDLDLESESVEATYDSARDSTSLAVVAVVAAALGEDPRALTPLHTAVDTDALDELATEALSGQGACDSISFRYAGLEITVTDGDAIEATPVAAS